MRSYTREAGVRNLEREIGRVCRKVARGVTEGKTDRVVIDVAKVREFLGPEKFFSEIAERVHEPGVATGLAWTPERRRNPLHRGDSHDGQEGPHADRPSRRRDEGIGAGSAVVHPRARGEDRHRADFFEQSDIHVHVPAGAIPKDGPSAGVTMAVALASLLTGRVVRHDLAMTGEITLRGKVLPVGGIKEKVLAANRAGISTVILPKRNAKDLEELADNVRQAMTFFFVETIDETLEHALEPKQEAPSAEQAPVSREASRKRAAS